ncbi:alpha-amylase family glycosyl hydrolase [Mesobacillus foraminis]|uniref:alpha-amylase family glycosyl hydrolase n=1 Tax=Mesobacillus foraminis TaxID=279826 RepID=UPI0039A05C74
MKRAWLAFITIPFLLFYALPVGAVEKEERKWQDETIYFLMVDRFNNGDNSNDLNIDTKDPEAYHGGDFEGVIKQLDYIKDMGFTAIWLSPVFDNAEDGYHGYWVNDFYKIDEHFGSMETFKQLVKEAHKRDIKVILDFVVNHVSPEHPWLKDSSKADWFHPKQAEDGDDQQEREDSWLQGLPDLNQDNPEVREYLIEAAQWWITETDIDGYHLDDVQNVPVDFWSEFTQKIKGAKSDFYLLGEVGSKDPREIAQYDKAGFDGLLDYPLNEDLRTAFAKPDQPLEALLAAAEGNGEVYEAPFLMANFMDNHNTVRFTRDAVQNNQHPGARWRLALTYLYTVPGIPVVYYGSEIALDGGEEPDNRRQMNFMTDKELIDYITQLGELRNQHPSLTRGSFDLLHEKDGMAVYKRTYKDEVSIIAINNTSKSQDVTLTEEELEKDKEMRGMLSGDLVRSTDGKYKLVLDREEAEIYSLADRSGLNIPYLTVMGAVYAAFFLFIFLVWRRAKRKRS